MTFFLMLMIGVYSLIAFHYVTELYQGQIYDEAAETLNISSNLVDNELRELEQLSFQMITDDRIQTYLQFLNRSEHNYEAHRMTTLMQSRILHYEQQEKYIVAIQVLSGEGSTYTIGDERPAFEKRTEWLSAASRAEGRIVWLPVPGEENVVVALREIRAMENVSMEHLGYVLIYMDMKKLVDETLNLSPGKHFLISLQDKPVFSTDEAFVDLTHNRQPPGKGYEIVPFQSGRYLVAYSMSSSQPLTYFNILPYEVIAEKTGMVKNAMLFIFMMVFLLALAIGHKVSHGITRPLENLTLRMKKVQEGQFDTVESRFEHDSEDETAQLHRNFRTMLEQINTLIKENYEKQLIIKETEYRALQSQINPHFLYNTLNSVTWMAKVNKQEQIASVVESLGNMMRSIVSKKEPLIQIGEELQIVKDYVNIQRVRYKERLQFCLEVDPGLEQFFIPKLTIQPIVENAILHGVGAVTKGKVSVSVLSRQKDIFVVVEDDGPGMNEATVQDIFAGKVKSKGTGIGLKNIHDRLQLIFGERYGIEVESELENGTKVMFNIPYEKR